MLNNELEKGLRDRLYDLEEAVNTDATWLAVEAGLRPKKKKRRGIIWWWLSGGFVLLALGGWLFWPAGDANHPGLLAEEVLEANAEVAIPATSERMTDQEEGVVAEDPLTVPNQVSEPSSRPKARKASSLLPDQDLAAKTTSGATASPSPVTSSTAKLDEFSTAPAPRRPKNAALVTTLVPQASTESTVTDVAEKATQSIPSEVASRLNAAASVATLPIALLSTADKDIFPKLPPIKENVDCYNFGNCGKRGWTLEVGGGVAKPYQTIVASLEDSLPYRHERDVSNERLLEAITADFLVGYQTASKWTLRGGLSYQRVNSVVEVRYDSTVVESREGIAEIIIDPGGDTTFINGMVSASIRTNGYNRYYNQLTTVDFPLLLGKTFAKGKWRIGLEAGPVFNLLTSGSARYQLTDGTFSTRAENDELFRSRLGGISWRANVSAGLLLMPGLEVNIGLSALRRGRGGFEVEGSATQTSYDLVGVRVGIRQQQ